MKEEQDFINNFTHEREITTQFLIKDKQVRKSKKKKPYLELTLHDKTGDIKGRMFSNKTYKMFNKVKTNTIFTINGKIQEFPENSKKFNILINTIHKSLNYDKDDFIKTANNYEANKEYFYEIIDTIEDEQLKAILDSFFKDDKFSEKFLTAPAAKIHHHNYKGGLLIHINEVVKICDTLANIYPEINRDLLITGAILHDIGKTQTYTSHDDIIEINTNGRMLDHLYLGANMVEEKLKKLNTDEDLRIAIIHMILSHHGKTDLGWGSAVDPKTPEALALHYADDISAKITKQIDS